MGRLRRGAINCAATGTALALLFSGGVSGAPAQQPGLRSVTVAMGYFANVQFAPFYVALQKGYYRQAGLNVHFNYGTEPDLLRLASIGKVDFVNSGGDEVLSAGAHGLRVRYILTQYSTFPSALFALRQTGIRRVGDLRGHSIGIPYTFGASYIGLLALLGGAGIPESSVSIKSIGFTQVESVAHRKVDAAVGYAMQEPVQLRQEGYRVQEFDIYRWANIAGAGIATGDAEMANHPDIVRAFVRATIRGMADTLRKPQEAYALTVRTVPGLAATSRAQRATLRRALDFWRPEAGHPLGWIDPRIWTTTAQLLYRFKQIPHPVAATAFYTNRFVPGQ